MSTSTTTTFAFDAALAASTDKDDRQLRHRDRFLVVDCRSQAPEAAQTVAGLAARAELEGTAFGVVAEQRVFRDGAAIEIRRYRATPDAPETDDLVFSDGELRDHGLVFVRGDSRTLVLFEGSVLSNFEKTPIDIGHGAPFSCVEQAFQCAKGVFVERVAPNPANAELLQLLLTTNAQDYMVKIARAFPMSPDVIAEWQRVNVDVLEQLVVLKADSRPDIAARVRAVLETLDIADLSTVEFWECNKYDDHYGVKMDLKAALKVAAASDAMDASDAAPAAAMDQEPAPQRYVSPDDAAVVSHGAARNHMGRILGIALLDRPSASTRTARAAATRLLTALGGAVDALSRKRAAGAEGDGSPKTKRKCDAE